MSKGKPITKESKVLYMTYKDKGLSQKAAAAGAGISRQSASSIDHGKHNTKRKERENKPNPEDHFKAVWDKDVLPMLESGISSAKFILLKLQTIYQGKFSNNVLRTLQRRVKDWKSLKGKNKEVIFPQKQHAAGMFGICDFTRPKDIVITIKGLALEFIFFHFRLPFSGYTYVQVFRGRGESFTAFAEALQNALYEVGGAPTELRTDSLSAAYKNLKKNDKAILTERFKFLLEHLGIKPSRNNPSKAHENGAIESPNGHFKYRLRNELLFRGSIDFSSFEEFQGYIKGITARMNLDASKRIDIEQPLLQPLPETRGLEYEEATACVTNSSTIAVKNVTYSVPSRLIGRTLSVRIYNQKLECYLGREHTIALERVPTPSKGSPRRVVANYLHVIHSLAAKPRAFRNYLYRDELLPTTAYVQIWEYVNGAMESDDACKFIVKLLRIAADENCRDELAEVVIDLIKNEKPLKISDLQDQFKSDKPSIPAISVPQHLLAAYNDHIPNYQKGK